MAEHGENGEKCRETVGNSWGRVENILETVGSKGIWLGEEKKKWVVPLQLVTNIWEFHVYVLLFLEHIVLLGTRLNK